VKAYKVYRVDYLTKMKTPIGTVAERRSRPRDIDSHFSLVKLARKVFAQSPDDQLRIVLGEEVTA